MSGLTDLWTTFTWMVFDVASTPQVMIPVSLGALAGIWVVKQPRWLKGVGKAIAVMLLVYGVLAMPIAAAGLTAGLTMWLPQSNGNESADAIVVLGRGEEVGYARYEWAVRLWRNGRAPKIFVTSIGKASYMVGRFKGAQWPMDVLGGTACSRTTYEEAISAAAILKPKNVPKIILVTDPPHALRATLAMQAVGFQVLPELSPLSDSFSALERSFLALREYLGLVSYTFLGRLQRHEATEVAVKSQRSIEEEVLSNCKIEWLSGS
ncbi:MAG: YdcF family protein [Cyanobacteria bacterium J06636_16]